MNIFSGLKVWAPMWEIIGTRYLTQEEKDFTKCAIVVESQYGYSLEFFTRMGRSCIPISLNSNREHRSCKGYIPDIDKIKIITLQLRDEKDIIYRIEF